MIITNVVGKGNTPPITNAIYVILPLFTNVAATVLIGYKTWFVLGQVLVIPFSTMIIGSTMQI